MSANGVVEALDVVEHIRPSPNPAIVLCAVTVVQRDFGYVKYQTETWAETQEYSVRWLSPGYEVTLRTPIRSLMPLWEAASVGRIASAALALPYPAPIVDNAVAARATRDPLHAIRTSANHREVAHKIIAKHESHKAGILRTEQKRRAKPKAAIDRQFALDF